ncbi:MAG TPA: cell surface protein, partial [Pirellulaceae bacterium]|nr:cell surface protein [Pirellulaceae bacterium]
MSRRLFKLMLLVMLAVFGACDQSARAADLEFAVDVMSVLSKAGCNSGTCHGNLNGKGGFKLSLRGQDPRFDHEALVRKSRGRRVNPASPDESLLLLKATAQVPHRGGRRFDVSSAEYTVLREWIAEGVAGPTSCAPQVIRLEV